MPNTIEDAFIHLRPWLRASFKPTGFGDIGGKKPHESILSKEWEVLDREYGDQLVLKHFAEDKPLSDYEVERLKRIL